ncbi:glutamine synthetase family protein [Thiolinea disciformis]|uniref:glutamine synthetase family protein n=1 Tax=Thiolinea disciformis TaxID=125614 RepID=UPI000371EFD9|nr:glutamine synthetase family protein [Thiolinea disciformis]
MNHFDTISELDVFITDLNGNQRGKRVASSAAPVLHREGFKLPRSVMGVDFWGDDVIANGLVFETGDSDGVCKLVSENLLPVPWASGGHFQAIATMFNPDGTPFYGDPRQILSHVVERYKAHGYTPVTAAELEFYLLKDESENTASPVTSPWLMEQSFNRPDAYSIANLDAFRPLLAELRHACAALQIPADAIIAEFGDGQFEVNLNHIPDALLAADQTMMFKRMVKRVARNHGHLASFMAKTYSDRSGSGFHMHFSVLDEEGNNIFANGTPEGGPLLRHAVAGLLKALPDSMLIFAPHMNSYRRLQPGSHAPTTANWGYENRTVAIRIPESPDEARRIEHRVAGADANPYLVFAAILGAALYGIENKLEPYEVTQGNAYKNSNPERQLTTQWIEAMARLKNSAIIKEIMGEEFVRIFNAVKEQEVRKFSKHITRLEYATYLGSV